MMKYNSEQMSCQSPLTVGYSNRLLVTLSSKQIDCAKFTTTHLNKQSTHYNQ